MLESMWCVPETMRRPVRLGGLGLEVNCGQVKRTWIVEGFEYKVKTVDFFLRVPGSCWKF